MVRELAITIYLVIFKTLFTLCKLLPQKDKTTFVASFGDNIFYVAEELAKYGQEQIVIIKKASCRIAYEGINANKKILNFETGNPWNFIESIYHLATSKVIFVDNYYGFLSVTSFKENVICVQLWHAAGAIKRFGLMDPSILTRSKRAYRRFKEVYKRFHYVTVGSEKMARIFQRSFDLNEQNILRTGVPRTDIFFDKKRHSEIILSLQRKLPMIQQKKVILYAPTFRDDQLDSYELALNVDKLYQELKDEYILLLRIHPAANWELFNKYPGFAIDVSAYENINHLLLITDYLITDYSSIPFEYSLLEKPMIFFTYDFEEYQQSRGVWEGFTTALPGPTATNSEEVIHLILNHQFDLVKVKTFANEWNQYSRGLSSESLIQSLFMERKSKII
jgi:teichoic acid glycerol-phosphate primase